MYEDEYITVEEAAERLRLGERQTRNYGSNGKIRTKRAGQRVMFHRGDVEALAAELGSDNKPRPKPPRLQLMAPGEIVPYIERKDHQITELQERLNQAALQIGHLQGQLEAGRLLLEDKRRLEEKINQLEEERRDLMLARQQWEQERAALEAELEERRRPWWKRLFGG